MKYVVELHGERMTVEYDGTHAVIDGERIEVSLVRVAGTPVRLLRVGNEVHRLLAQRSGDRGHYALDLDGERHNVVALDERSRTIQDLTAAQAVSTGPAPLVAPMPGLVVRIAVAVGDMVSAGPGLVVIEAMKMENELRASAPAIVTAIRAIAGTAVNKGAVLVELGPIA